VALVRVPATVVRWPPGEAVTVKALIEAPPLSTGQLQLTNAAPLLAAAMGLIGTDGTRGVSTPLSDQVSAVRVLPFSPPKSTADVPGPKASPASCRVLGIVVSEGRVQASTIPS
jgi:hypothetical protein